MQGNEVRKLKNDYVPCEARYFQGLLTSDTDWSVVDCHQLLVYHKNHYQSFGLP
jgi:hypothetical protein